MRRILAATLLFVAFAMLPLFAQTNPWTAVADKLKASIVFLENCTGFVIDSAKKHVLTAAHCEPADKKYLVDGTQAYRMFVDYRKDLMVLRAHQMDKPALRLAANDPKWGDEVATLGFGWALEFPMFRVSHISHPRFEIEQLSGPFVVVDTSYVGGQSGGPVVNRAGEVVSIVQRGDSDGTFGFGVGAETIKDRVGRYFEQ
jgi:S1-C subfamily serine protease